MAWGHPVIHFSFTGTRRDCMTEHSFRECSNLTRPLWLNLTTLPETPALSLSSHRGWHIRVDLSPAGSQGCCMQPIFKMQVKSWKIQPDFMHQLNRKKTLVSIVTQPHSLLVCLLSFFSPLYSSLLSHAWNRNKADSTARMNPVPDVSKKERRRSQTSHNVPPDDS